MKISSVIAAPTLFGLCIASNAHQHGHENLYERREAILAGNAVESSANPNASCGCTTSYTTIYGAPTLLPMENPPMTTATAHKPATSPSPAPEKEDSNEAEKPAQFHEVPAPKADKPAPPVKKPKEQANKKPDTHSKTPINSSGSQWSMTYSPYTSDGGCKPSSDVAGDIAMIAKKGFSSIRLYSTDCSGLSSVATAALSHNMNIILGVYISDTGISAARPQIAEVVQWANKNGHFKGVEMIVIGNEAVFNKFCSAAELASFVAEAKTAFSAAGYTGPVTTTETVETLKQNKETLCPVCDVAAANIHPFFNGKVTADGAGEFVAEQLELLATICPGKEVFNLETGWPTKGSANGAAIPGQWEQSVAVEGIKRAAGGK
ncbi:MAG: hypothetical protein Q9174_006716, partial [Haloplaca sp. 1 TL-2023]